MNEEKQYQRPLSSMRTFKIWEALSDVEKKRVTQGGGERAFVNGKIYWSLNSMNSYSYTEED